MDSEYFLHRRTHVEYVVIILAAACLYFFSPLFAWFLLLLVLGLMSSDVSDLIRRMMGFLLIVTIATLVASRKFGITESDDFAGSYYPVFVDISNGNLNALFSYGKGLEVGLPLLWYVIALFNPDASSIELIFWTVLFSVGIFWIWIEYYGLAEFDHSKKATVIAISLLMCSCLLSSQLVRQFFSSVILLFAISGKRLATKSLFLFLASSFHLTALPIYFFILLAKKSRVALYFFIPCGIFFALCLNEFVQFVLAHQYFPGFEKALYILNNAEPFSATDINAGKYLAVVCTLALISFYKKKLPVHVVQWRSVLLTTTFLYCCFLLIPQFSLRSTLLVSQIILGWLLVVIVGSVSWQLVRLFFLVFLFNRVMAMAMPSPGDPMGFWGQFPYWGMFPGYFFDF